MCLKILVFIALLQGYNCYYEGWGREGFGPGPQDWGYVTVRPQAHMFWWLYYAAPPVTPLNFNALDKPLVIWLQGGPGGSGTGYGNFEEFGPLNTDLQSRNYSWVDDYNLLLIDNPVGAGFSYVDNLDSLARDNYKIAEDLVECMRGIFAKIPALELPPTYLVGESYGGKMVVEFAIKWHEAQKNSTIKGNLKGIALGDASISPIDSLLASSSYLFNIGLIDNEMRKKLNDSAYMAKYAVDHQEFDRAFNLRNEILDTIANYTGNADFYNILNKAEVVHEDFKDHQKLYALMNGPVKEKLQLISQWTLVNDTVRQSLNSERMKSIVSRVELLLEKTDLKLFVYSGQLDLIISTPATLAWVEKLKWKKLENWKNARRESVVVNNVVEGFKKSYGQFAVYWISRSGHMVPRDNPVAMAQMLSDLTNTNSIYRYFYST